MKKFFCLSWLILTTISGAEEKKNIEFDFKKNTEKYSIKYNDTLARIALTNNVSVAFLLYLNNDIYNPDRIYAGQEILVPNKEAQLYVKTQSKNYSHLIAKMGAMTYKERHNAIKEMINKDWLAIPILRQALDHKDVEIRENAREALREIHRNKNKAMQPG